VTLYGDRGQVLAEGRLSVEARRLIVRSLVGVGVDLRGPTRGTVASLEHGTVSDPGISLRSAIIDTVMAAPDSLAGTTDSVPYAVTLQETASEVTTTYRDLETGIVTQEQIFTYDAFGVWQFGRVYQYNSHGSLILELFIPEEDLLDDPALWDGWDGNLSIARPGSPAPSGCGEVLLAEEGPDCKKWRRAAEHSAAVAVWGGVYYALSGGTNGVAAAVGATGAAGLVISGAGWLLCALGS
jgi:hypothetical protein